MKLFLRVCSQNKWSREKEIRWGVGKGAGNLKCMDGGVAVPLPGGLCFASDLKLDSYCAHLCDEDTAYVCTYALLIKIGVRGRRRGVTIKISDSLFAHTAWLENRERQSPEKFLMSEVWTTFSFHRHHRLGLSQTMTTFQSVQGKPCAINSPTDKCGGFFPRRKASLPTSTWAHEGEKTTGNQIQVSKISHLPLFVTAMQTTSTFASTLPTKLSSTEHGN